MNNNRIAERIIRSRGDLLADLPAIKRADGAAEGGCGVLGFASNHPVAGQHVLAASSQMHNRGNGKGGGIAMVGLDAAQARVDSQILQSHTLLQIALLDPEVRQEVEQAYIYPHFEVAQAYEIDHLSDYRQVAGLEVRPPDVWRYFVRAKPEILAEFAVQQELEALSARALEDEFVYQNSFRLNSQFYASLGEQRAFVLSHGRNLSVLKIVGYAEQVVEYYRLEEQTAHVWIAHQRYPTKGRVWHPGGAHPFIGLNEALVHNGDFANYHAVSEYLRQRNIGQLFLTDTEVSVQLFDLWNRVYRYPLEITLEAMAPTTDFDFSLLPPDKKALYQAVQRTHMHGSPDGPWFFILARSLGEESANKFELLGITDTSMLRPQVFAHYENGDTQIGLIASERQAINACLRSLSAQDPRYQPFADRYWVARGGSHTDGGAFRFTVAPEKENSFSAGDGLHSRLRITDKFGAPLELDNGRWHVDTRQLEPDRTAVDFRRWWGARAVYAFDDGGPPTMWRWLKSQLARLSWDELAWGLDWLIAFGSFGDEEWAFTLEMLNYLNDRHYDAGCKKRASIIRLVSESLACLFEAAPRLDPQEDLNKKGRSPHSLEAVRRLDWENRHALDQIVAGEALFLERPDALLVIDALEFPPEGDQAAARLLVQAKELGWRHIIVYNWRGGRFAACGLGPKSQELRIDLYGDVGDYAASGLDGAQVHLHGAGQDQVGQIFKSGKLVIYGDAGQTFLYGAKGGEVYVMGSVAGRPLINAVGKPRAVINGTALDYLAESFMAGDPHRGGGFVIINGVAFDEDGALQDLESPYPGGNLFSLASGGAIYLRDPYRKIEAEQVNGGNLTELSPADWELIEPYLQENEKLFGIRLDDLLTINGERRSPLTVYRKVQIGLDGLLSDVENR